MQTRTAKPSDEIYKVSTNIIVHLFFMRKLDYSDVQYKNEYIQILSYFLYYGFIPLYMPDSYSSTDICENALISLASAPWMAAVSERLRTPLNKFIELKILTFKNNFKEINICISLNINYDCFPEKEIRNINYYYSCAVNDHEKRLLLHKDMGWTIGAGNLKSDLEEIIKNEQGRVIIKIIAYHGRTWFGIDSSCGFIQDMLYRYKDLFVKILLVDKNADITVREGATVEEHSQSSINGLQNIYNLNSNFKKRVDIRLYGKSIKTAFLRGMIIENSEGDILNAHITNWRFGYERGIYGKELILHNESSLSKLCNQYFDDVFSDAKPCGGIYYKLIYYLKKNYKLMFILATPIIIIWLSFLFSKGNGSAIYSTVESLFITVWSLIIPAFIGKLTKKNE